MKLHVWTLRLSFVLLSCPLLSSFMMKSTFFHNRESLRLFGKGSSSSTLNIKKCDAVVVGGGISGTTAAYYLKKNGIDTILTESRDRIGGNLISVKEDGYLWEEGPNSFQPNTASLRLAKDLGMLEELVLADPSLPRFVFWNNMLHALPGSIQDLTKFNLLSWEGKIRAFLGAIGFVAPEPQSEECIEEFICRHLGKEAFDRIIDPFVSGVYAGDPKKLSMKAALKKVYNLEKMGFTRGIVEGAIVRMFQMAQESRANKNLNLDLPKIPAGSLASFRNGLQSLPLKIQENMGSVFNFNHKLTKLEMTGKNRWLSSYETPHGLQQIESSMIIITIPSWSLSPILSDSFPELNQNSHMIESLASICYPPVASVTLAYPNQAFRHSMVGFGNLIPRSLNIRTLGTIWSSSLFPGRAPPGQTLLLSYIGGAQYPEILQHSKDKIVAQVDSDIRRILLKEGSWSPRVLGVRLWEKAIPQYERGHLEKMNELENRCSAFPGLFIGGNYKNGVAFGDCIQFGCDIAKNASNYFLKK